MHNIYLLLKINKKIINNLNKRLIKLYLKERPYKGEIDHYIDIIFNL